MAEESSVIVALRVRPLSARDLESGGPTLSLPASAQRTDAGEAPIARGKERLLVTDPANSSQRHTFSAHHVFWSLDPGQAPYAGQDDVYRAIGPVLMRSVFDGFNACLFAYGQTGSGKTHSMLGQYVDTRTERGATVPVLHPDEFGVVPRFCVELFKRIVAEQAAAQDTKFTVTCSFAEIYCERTHDILSSTPQAPLRLRQHPLTGPYVEGLTSHVARSPTDVVRLLERGMQERATAETKMNARSSRSHAIFTMTVSRVTLVASESGNVSTKTRTSKVNLVDLAGSERVAQSGAQGDRLEEAKNINLSLHALGRVITTLAERAEAQATGGRSTRPPYRDSVLTWLLSDSLGGNSKTIMLATVSAAKASYSQSLSTLRFATLAQTIVNAVTVNEEKSDAEVIASLRDRVARLTLQIESGEASSVMQRRVTSLVADLEASRSECRELDLKLTAAAASRTSLDTERARLRELEHARSAMALEHSKAAAEQERRVLGLQRDLQRKEDDLRRGKEDMAEVRASHARIVAELRREAEAARKADVATACDRAAAREGDLETAVRDLEAQREAAAQEVVVLEQRVAVAERSNKELTAANDALAGRVDSLTAENTELSVGQARLKEEITAVTTAAVASDATVTDATDAAAALRTELATVRQTAASQRAANVQLRLEATRATSGAAKLSEEAEALRGDVQELELLLLEQTEKAYRNFATYALQRSYTQAAMDLAFRHAVTAAAQHGALFSAKETVARRDIELEHATDTARAVGTLSTRCFHDSDSARLAAIADLRSLRHELEEAESVASERAARLVETERQRADAVQAAAVDRAESADALAASRTEAARLAAERDEVAQQLSTAEENVAESVRQCQLLEQESEQRGAAASALQEEVDGLRQQLDVQAAEAETKAEALTETAAEQSKLQSAFLDAQAELRDLRVQINISRSEAITARATAGQRERAVDAAQREIAALRQHREGEEGVLARVKDEFDRCQRAAAAEASSLREAHSRLQTQHETAVAAVHADYADRFAKEASSRTAAEDKASRAKATATALQVRVDVLAAERDEAIFEQRAAKAESDRRFREVSSQRDQFQRRLTAMEGLLEELQRDKGELEEQLEHSRRRLASPSSLRRLTSAGSPDRLAGTAGFTFEHYHSEGESDDEALGYRRQRLSLDEAITRRARAVKKATEQQRADAEEFNKCLARDLEEQQEESRLVRQRIDTVAQSLDDSAQLDHRHSVVDQLRRLDEITDAASLAASMAASLSASQTASGAVTPLRFPRTLVASARRIDPVDLAAMEGETAIRSRRGGVVQSQPQAMDGSPVVGMFLACVQHVRGTTLYWHPPQPKDSPANCAFRKLQSVFLPQSDLANRTSFATEAGCDVSFLYHVAEFTGQRYKRNTLRFTVGIAFRTSVLTGTVTPHTALPDLERLEGALAQYRPGLSAVVHELGRAEEQTRLVSCVYDELKDPTADSAECGVDGYPMVSPSNAFDGDALCGGDAFDEEPAVGAAASMGAPAVSAAAAVEAFIQSAYAALHSATGCGQVLFGGGARSYPTVAVPSGAADVAVSVGGEEDDALPLLLRAHDESLDELTTDLLLIDAYYAVDGHRTVRGIARFMSEEDGGSLLPAVRDAVAVLVAHGYCAVVPNVRDERFHHSALGLTRAFWAEAGAEEGHASLVLFCDRVLGELPPSYHGLMLGVETTAGEVGLEQLIARYVVDTLLPRVAVEPLCTIALLSRWLLEAAPNHARVADVVHAVLVDLLLFCLAAEWLEVL